MLLNEPSVGLDTVYDGAHQMMSTEYLFGARGGRWSTGQGYGASFRSATPRPWQRPETRQESMTPKLGPGDYDVLRETHTLSASIGWSTRGRCGDALPPLLAACDHRHPLSCGWRLIFSRICSLRLTSPGSALPPRANRLCADRVQWGTHSTLLVGRLPSSPLSPASTLPPRRSAGAHGPRTAWCSRPTRAGGRWHAPTLWIGCSARTSSRRRGRSRRGPG